MKLKMSMFADAFLGSGVPLGGDPITFFERTPLLGLRAATVVDNCNPMVGQVVKVRVMATNCGARGIEVIRSVQAGGDADRQRSDRNATTLLPGESLEYCLFHCWDAPGEHQLTLAYEARCAGHPFARLTYPTVAIHVRAPEGSKLLLWIWWARAALTGVVVR